VQTSYPQSVNLQVSQAIDSMKQSKKETEGRL
jgi:hypothetical protein